jgi:DMSO/TMAO reductase YedYZ molybdopterin-dependent catalytic subunit
MIVREKEPLNLEMPFASLNNFLTPSDRFFIRSHFAIPEVDLKTWRLHMEGEVAKPLKISFEELKEMASITVPVTLECAGNGRALLSPQTKGAQWERGAVSNAEWTGVPLTDVLRRAGVNESALEVILAGADKGEIKDEPSPAGKVHFARSIPMQKAKADVLLALKMNGEDLSAAHGAPVRAIVPGWYGMASVKWLTQIVVASKPFHGYYQTVDYAFWERGPAGPVLVPISEMQVKAQIARPGIGDSICAGEVYRVQGAAWTADAEISKVEFSADGGETWSPAHLKGESVRNAWRFWEFDWQAPTKRGKATLMAKATDSLGRTQPVERDDDRGGYIVNHVLPIEVDVH